MWAVDSHSETAIPAHPNPPLHRRQLDRPRLRLRDTKERIPRLRVQQIVLGDFTSLGGAAGCALGLDATNGGAISDSGVVGGLSCRLFRTMLG